MHRHSLLRKRIGLHVTALCLAGVVTSPAIAQLPTNCPGTFYWTTDYTYTGGLYNLTYVFNFNGPAPFTPDFLPGTTIQVLNAGKYVFGTLTSTNGKAIGQNAYIKAHCERWVYPGGYITEVIDDGAWIPQIILLDEQEESENLGPCDDMETCGGGGEGGGGSGGGGGGGSSGGPDLWRICYRTDYYDENWNYLYSSTPVCHYDWI